MFAGTITSMSHFGIQFKSSTPTAVDPAGMSEIT